MKNLTETKLRFTTIIQPSILTKIKLIAYFTNNTISDIVEIALIDYLNNFEEQNNIKIDDLMNIKENFNSKPTIVDEDDIIEEELTPNRKSK